jgi:DNA/RNA-binding domain of Phe-tRNA-synthetase-like protein
MPTTIAVDPHPELHLGAFEAAFPAPLGGLPAPPWLVELLRADAAAPLERSEEVRAAVRDLLRHGGYKPTGRGKPASEYLVRAAADGTLAPINLAVDASNAASLHSGFPASVVDLDLARPPFRVGLPGAGASYVFNASGQEIRVEGLLSLFDAEGPCAGPVKDSQRTKTHAGTTGALCLIWGCRSHADRADRAVAWFREVLERAGARCEDVVTV